MGALRRRRRAAGLVAVACLAAACGKGGAASSTTGSSTAASGASGATGAASAASSAAASTASVGSTTTAAAAAVDRTPLPRLRPGPDGCDHRAPPAGTHPTFEQPPPSPLTEGENATLVLYTSCGHLRVFLDRTRGGAVTDAVAGLAATGFYDGLGFHRVAPGYVAQGGDPTGTGTGDAGFSVRQAPPADYLYQHGDVAMARASNEPAGTAGSQFFVVLTGAGADALNALGPPPTYAIIGHATDDASLKTIARIDALGVDDGPPVQPVYIWATRLVPETP